MDWIMKTSTARLAKFAVVLSLLLTSLVFAQGPANLLEWHELSEIPPAENMNYQPGLAGAFSGISNGALIIAGGANFPKPEWESEKEFHNDIYVLDENGNWHIGNSLPSKIAYGMSVTIPEGILCIGGTNGESITDQVFLLKWNGHSVNRIDLQKLPFPLAYGYATISGNYIYLAGGQTDLGLESATHTFLRLNINNIENSQWEELPGIPGGNRAFNLTISQHNGQYDCIYVFSGRRFDESGNYEFLTDVWEYNITTNSWHQKADLPRCVMAGTGIDVGDSHIYILGGADGSLVAKAEDLKQKHPGFPKEALVYHTITDSWTTGGEMPTNQVTTRAFYYKDKIIIPSGEIKPRIRTPKLWEITIKNSKANFGLINSITLGIYLFAMVMIGFYFAKKNKNTDDYFRGGQQIPWWAAACSIFATMLSSITYMAIPAKAFATNWEFLLAYPMILIVSIFVIKYILPFFRKIDATSAYEYLEMRFNQTTRMIASALFIVFQIGRMAIVMFLSALALSTSTPLTPMQRILLMGILSIIYSTLGGVEAVVWTDTIQTLVLLGGALLACGWIFFHFTGGIGEFFTIAAAHHKFHMINWDWSSTSYMTAAFWIIVLGAFGQNLISYSSDQAVIQRYMTTSDEKKAAKSILTNGVMSQFAGILFFTIGTALFVFYKQNPQHLDPTFKTDAILPLFIVNELPVGISGIIIAGIFAAAQSTISTSMNATSSAFVTDFSRKIWLNKNENYFLNQARIFTVIVGVLGTATALLFASAEIKSLFDQFIAIIGLFGASICGLFLLGIFTKKANGTGAVFGAIIGAITLFIAKNYTATHFYIYSTIGISTTMVAGYLSSLPFDKNHKERLTIYSINNVPQRH